jgi:hypothetical protein
MVGFEVVDPRYLALYERACAVLGADERVERVEVAGSIAAGTADEWSDLDLTVVVRPDARDDFLEEWPRWLASITPPGPGRCSLDTALPGPLPSPRSQPDACVNISASRSASGSVESVDRGSCRTPG